jgi:hypothetical protein
VACIPASSWEASMCGTPVRTTRREETSANGTSWARSHASSSSSKGNSTRITPAVPRAAAPVIQVRVDPMVITRATSASRAAACIPVSSWFIQLEWRSGTTTSTSRERAATFRWAE